MLCCEIVMDSRKEPAMNATMMNRLGRQICPLDPAHVVPIQSYQNHIIRCLRNYKGRKISCPYKATEFFYPEELQEHMKKCQFAPINIHVGENRGAFPPTVFFHKDLPVDFDDDWD